MAPSRVYSAPGLTPSSRESRSRSPAQSARARPRPGRSLQRNHLGRDPACRRGHRNRVYRWLPPFPAFMPRRLYRRAASGAFEPPQDLALLVIARDKDAEGGHAANRLRLRCVERGIPSIVIDSRMLRFQRRPHCLRGRNPRGPDRPPYCKYPARGNWGREGWEWENNYPVMMSHCVTRSHCANPCGVLHSANAPLRR